MFTKCQILSQNNEKTAIIEGVEVVIPFDKITQVFNRIFDL